jgi:hypothetical protein
MCADWRRRVNDPLMARQQLLARACARRAIAPGGSTDQSIGRGPRFDMGDRQQ